MLTWGVVRFLWKGETRYRGKMIGGRSKNEGQEMLKNDSQAQALRKMTVFRVFFLFLTYLELILDTQH